MGSPARYGNRVLLGLALLLVAQLTLLAIRRSAPPPPPPPRFLVEGDSLGGVELETEGTASSTTLAEVARGRPAVLMVFYSECAHCEVVAESWRRWTEERPADVAVFLVSREARIAASEYRRRHAWDAPLVRVQDPRPGTAELSLVMRTPWLVVTDEQGVVRYQNHGSHLDEMDAVLADLRAEAEEGDRSG